MSLVTYEEVRPWIRSIKARVASREMPPWHLDKGVGIQKFINDRSLSDSEIDTIVRWIDAGAPRGDMKDMPRAEAVAERRSVLPRGELGPPDLDRAGEAVHDAGAVARRPLRNRGRASATDRAAMGARVRDEAVAGGPANRPPRQHVSDPARRRPRRSRPSGRCGPDSPAPTW